MAGTRRRRKGRRSLTNPNSLPITEDPPWADRTLEKKNINGLKATAAFFKFSLSGCVLKKDIVARIKRWGEVHKDEFIEDEDDDGDADEDDDDDEDMEEEPPLNNADNFNPELLHSNAMNVNNNNNNNNDDDDDDDDMEVDETNLLSQLNQSGVNLFQHQFADHPENDGANVEMEAEVEVEAAVEEEKQAVVVVVDHAADIREWCQGKDIPDEVVNMFTESGIKLDEMRPLTKDELQMNCGLNFIIANRIFLEFEKEEKENNNNGNGAGVTFSPNRGVQPGDDANDWIRTPNKPIKYIGVIEENWKTELRYVVLKVTMKFLANHKNSPSINVKEIRHVVCNGTKTGNAGKVRFYFNSQSGKWPNGPTLLTYTMSHKLESASMLEIWDEKYEEKSHGGRMNWSARCKLHVPSAAWERAGTTEKREELVSLINNTPQFDWKKFGEDVGDLENMNALGLVGDIEPNCLVSLQEALTL